MQNYNYCETLPKIALGFLNDQRVDFFSKYFNFKDLQKVAHQCDGIACDHVYLDCELFQPATNILELCKNLAHEFCCVNIIRDDLEETINYRNMLQSVGLDCRYSFYPLKEGAFPVDCNAENFKILTGIDLDLDEWLTNHIEYTSQFRFFVDLDLFILTENCD